MNPTRRQVLSSFGALLAVPQLSSAGRPHPVGELAASHADGFLRAVREGDLARVQRLLGRDPSLARSIDANGRSAFVLAHLAGHVEVAAALLASGLELDVVEAVLAEDWPRLKELLSADPARGHAAHPIGGTPVYAAALCGSLDLWRLRSLGCDQDLAPPKGTGFTPARGAMDSARATWAAIALADLLGNGADPNAPQRDGDSILHGAVRRRSEALVRLAVRKGVAIEAADAEGRTPRDLAVQLGWTAGAALLAEAASLPRDHRASRLLLDADRRPIVRPDLSDVAQAVQNEVTGASHSQLAKLRELVGRDRRLVFSVSTDDELAIEAGAHVGDHAITRFHLDHGAPLSLPTAVSLGDREAIEFWLQRDPALVHERGAHDFPLMWYALLGGGGPEIAALLHSHGAAVDQDSVGTTTLHWCARRDAADLAVWLLDKGADRDAVGHRFQRDGETPLQVATRSGSQAVVDVLRAAGARR